MATRVLTRLYDHHEDAVATVQGLEQAGLSHDDISLVGGNQSGRYAPGDPAAGTLPAETSPAESVPAASHSSGAGAGAGATLGTLLGGGAGLLAGIGAIAIPGVGPVIAAGWLVAALTGAGIGAAALGLVGSLTDAGVPREDAEVYAEGVRRGGFLVTARVDDGRVAEAQRILSHRGVDVGARREEYRSAGWSGFDPDAPMPATSDTAPATTAPSPAAHRRLG